MSEDSTNSACKKHQMIVSVPQEDEPSAANNLALAEKTRRSSLFILPVVSSNSFDDLPDDTPSYLALQRDRHPSM